MSGRTCGTHRKKVDSAAHIKRALHSQDIFLHKPTTTPNHGSHARAEDARPL